MDNSDPERFPSILRFHAGQTASGEVVIPYAAVERKVLPAPVIALTSISEHAGKCQHQAT